MLQQARNRRSNVIVQHQGKTMCLSEAVELSGTAKKYETIRRQLRSWKCSFDEIIGEVLFIRKNSQPQIKHERIEAFLEAIKADTLSYLSC
jgi:hypothetical protein